MSSPVIRNALSDAHHQVLNSFAAPGDHWSSADRAAIVVEIRRARSADPLPPWIAPSSVDGLIDSAHCLPLVAVDAIWRIANHPGSLTEDWFNETIDAGLDPSAYVELVAVVSMTVAIDDFYRAVGLPQLPLPPVADLPARTTSVATAVDVHWVPVQSGDMPNVRTALSAAPAEVEMQGVILDTHYVPGGALSVDLAEDIWSLRRTQVELVASRVSSVNECFY